MLSVIILGSLLVSAIFAALVWLEDDSYWFLDDEE